MQSAYPTANGLAGLITPGRTTGPGYHVISRAYPSGDAEVCAVKLESDDLIRRGGGAKRNHEKREDQDESVMYKSFSRSRKSIKRLCQSACFDRMLTLTFRENLTDKDQAWKCFHYFSKLMRWRFKDRWLYIAVPEFQKRGAVHFHLGVKGWFHIQTVRRFWLRAVGQYGGNVDITSPRKSNNKNSWNPRHISNYLAKYVAKEMVSEFNSRRYSSGGRIEVPPPIRGWLALGCPVIPVLTDVMSCLTRVPHHKVYEGEHRFYIFYLST